MLGAVTHQHRVHLHLSSKSKKEASHSSFYLCHNYVRQCVDTITAIAAHHIVHLPFNWQSGFEKWPICVLCSLSHQIIYIMTVSLSRFNISLSYWAVSVCAMRNAFAETGAICIELAYNVHRHKIYKYINVIPTDRSGICVCVLHFTVKKHD